MGLDSQLTCMLAHEPTQANMCPLLPLGIGPTEIDFTTCTFRAMFKNHLGGQTHCFAIHL